MPITFACPCGKLLKVGDEYAGKRAKCPECDAVVRVPESEPVSDPPRATARRVADEEDEADRPRKRPSRTVADEDDRPSRRSRRDEDDEEDDRPRRRRRDEQEDDDPPPRKKRLTDDGSAKGRKLNSDEVAQKPRSLEGKVANGGILGGLAAMVIAVVWFVVGLAADRIFIYPPILFILGLIGLIKGLVSAGSEE